MLWLIVSRMLHPQGTPKLRTPPLSSERHLEVQSVLDVGHNSMADKWPTTVVYEIVKSSEVKELTPLVMDTYEPRHGYLQAQEMDAYKLKRCVSTIRNKFHIPHTLDFLDINHFRWGRSWMSSGDGTSSSPFSHLIARKLLAERSPVTVFCICKGMTANGYWQPKICLPRTKTSGAKPALLLSKFSAWVHIAQISSTLGNGCSASYCGSIAASTSRCLSPSRQVHSANEHQCWW